MKKYLYGDERFTEKQAKEKFPNPLLLPRAAERMDRREIEAILRRNIQEIRFWCKQWELLANGEYAGKVTKRALVMDANRLHDWRVSMNIMASALGRPHLWEE